MHLFEGFKHLGYDVFNNCLELETIHLPSTLQSIDSDAFYDCAKLKEIDYNGTKLEWEKVQKSPTWRRRSSIYKVECIDGEINLK